MYLVKIVSKVEEGAIYSTAQKIALTLDTDTAKIEKLLSKEQATVGKAKTLEKAEDVASIFRDAGVKVAVVQEVARVHVVEEESKREVGFLLGLGIFFYPMIFSWFTLRKGYSDRAKKVAFGWLFSLMVFTIVVVAISVVPELNQEEGPSQTESVNILAPTEEGLRTENKPEPQIEPSSEIQSEELALGQVEGGKVSEPFDDNLVFELVVNNNSDNLPVLVGSTNLPNGTKISTSVSNDATGFLGQDTVFVRDGKFEAGPFGPKSGLSIGDYVANARMFAKRQSDSVKGILGEDGSNLIGDLVQKGSLGTVVSIEVPFQIGSEAEVTGYNEALVEEAYTIFQELQVVVQNGRNMEQVRHANPSQCVSEMRPNQAKVKILEEQADHLPFKYFSLKSATISAWSCVNCLPNALQHCDMASSFLEEAGELFE